SMREARRGTLQRLFAAVIAARYNKTPSNGRLDEFFTRVPSTTKAGIVARRVAGAGHAARSSPAQKTTGGPPMVTVCTFNANNLSVGSRFAENSPGAPANAPAAPSPANPATTASTKFGFLPAYEPGSFDVFNADQRQLAALALARGGDYPLPDLVVLQEIE